jgi:C4-dicarboxylate-specific signal transduction histidine kinase
LNINDIIGNVLNILHSEVIIQGMSIRTDLAADLPCVRGDRVQLEQVFINLIVNADHAMSGGETSPCTLFIKTSKDAEGRVVVSTQDTGPGIDEDLLERVFDPFRTTKAGGLGMGLAISRSIVEANDGRIWAENAPEGGARFHVALPAGDET